MIYFASTSDAEMVGQSISVCFQQSC